MLPLLYEGTVKVKVKGLSEPALNLFHLLVVPKGKVVNCVGEVQGSPRHVNLLDYFCERVS